MKINRNVCLTVLLILGVISSMVLSACQPSETVVFPIIRPTPTETVIPSAHLQTLTSIAPRPNYAPGELVDYIAQSGDNLPALASRFNTTVQEIRAANSILPQHVTTLPPGLPLKIPIYYRSLWGSSFQIIPDNAFINGPRLKDFNAAEFVRQQPGWLKNYEEYAGNQWLTGGEVVNHITEMYSISPQLLLAIIEYQTHALSDPVQGDLGDFPFGFQEEFHKGFYLQLVWVANTLNNGYYGWRTGRLISINRKDNTLENFDPWQNAATVALHYYYAQVLSGNDYEKAVLGEGLIQTYMSLFGDPWLDTTPLMEGSLEQPPLRLPFSIGQTWTFTGGPHTAWGSGDPLAAIDFAPPMMGGGCRDTDVFTTAVADGVIVRSDPAEVFLDLDGDGDERTGWVIFYLHVASRDRIAAGTRVKAGDPIGHPSCEGGEATGTHIHIARKYNGEWIPADGSLTFTMEGWIVKNGTEPYLGTMQKNEQIVIACACSDAASRITSTELTP